MTSASIGAERENDECRLDLRIARGTLPPDGLRRVAEAMFRFHREAPAESELTHLALPGATERRLEGMLAELRCADRLLEGAALDWIARALRSQLITGALQIRTRAVPAHQCAGHTDLRCEQVRITCADAGDSTVELDMAGRRRTPYSVDVCEDLTLLSVDLAGRGRVDFAERLLAAYAGIADDYGLYSVADFYEGLHACQRALWAVRLARRAGTPGVEAERAEAEAHRYIELALSTDRPTLLPRALVIMGGLLASGKSTVSAALAAVVALAVPLAAAGEM